MISSLLRRVLTTALIGAAGAAGTMVARRMMEKRSQRIRRVPDNERLELHRWEDEGGQPAEPASHHVRGASPL